MPKTVCVARRVASARARPALTPASLIASSTIRTNAGPEPARPVTASISFSSPTVIATPTAPKSSSAPASSPRVTPGAAKSAAAPAPTNDGVFGITRTTFAFGPSSARTLAAETPAAIEQNSGFEVCSASGASAASIPCGLTARTTMSLRASTSALSGVVATL